MCQVMKVMEKRCFGLPNAEDLLRKHSGSILVICQQLNLVKHNLFFHMPQSNMQELSGKSEITLFIVEFRTHDIGGLSLGHMIQTRRDDTNNPPKGLLWPFSVAGGEGFAAVRMIFSLVLVFSFFLFLFLLPQGWHFPISFLDLRHSSVPPPLAGYNLSFTGFPSPSSTARKCSWFKNRRQEDLRP